jgi:hypothetical protein
VKVSDERTQQLEERVLDRHGFHGEWNYTVLASPRPAPDPEPVPPPDPGPDLAAVAAVAGIADLPALLASMTVPFAAAREQRLHLDRGRARRKASGSGPTRLPYDAIATAAACHLRLRMPYRLLSELLGAHESTISLATRRITPILARHGITPAVGGTRISTLAELCEHAAAAGITLRIPGLSQTAPNHPQHEWPESTTYPKLKTVAAIATVSFRLNRAVHDDETLGMS